MSTSNRTVIAVATAGGVFVLATLGLLGTTDHSLISTIWPAAGFSLAALLTHGVAVAPYIAAAAATANWMHGAPVGAAAAMGVANAAGPVVAVVLLKRLAFDRTLPSPRHGALFIACGALLGPALSANLGISSLALVGSGVDSPAQAWVTWWSGDALGVLAFGPWFLQHYPGGVIRTRPSLSLTSVATITLMAVATAAAVLLSIRLSWLLFPIVGWRAVRDGTKGSASAVVIAAAMITALAVWSDPRESPALVRALEFNQSLLLGLSASALMLATFWQQLRDALARQLRLERLRDIAEELSGAGSWDWDQATGRLDWSKGLLRIYGVRDGEFGGRFEDYTRRLHPDDREAAMTIVQSAIDRGGRFRSEERIVRDADGELRVLESFGRVQRGPDGSTTLVGACLDITDRRRRDAHLRKALNHLQALIDASPLAILEMDEGARVLAWNASAERMFGWRADEIIGMANPLVPPAERAAFDEALARAFRGDAVVLAAQARVTKGGSQLLAQVSLAPVRDASGAVVSVVSILEDVTARERLEAALRESEADLLDLIHSAPVGIFRKTPQGELLMANQALADLLGYAGSEGLMASRRPHMLYFDAAERARLLAAFAAGAESLGAEVALRRQDGSAVRVQWDARAVRGRDGSVRYLECFVRDLTERLSAERRLRASRDQLAQLSRRVIGAQEAERQSVARGLHDEVGQMLTAIRLSLHALQTRLGIEPAPAELEDALATLELASRSVLDLSMDLRPAVLDDFGLEAALKWYAERAAARGSLEVSVSSTLGAGRLDPSVEVCCYRIAQEALTNVVRHASARRVWVSVSSTEPTISLSIRDDGVGFDVAAIMDAPHEARLGLLGMAERASLVGGRVDVTSRHGETVVTAVLPLHLSGPVFAGDWRGMPT